MAPNTHKKKMIAPIVVAVVLTLYYVAYFGFMAFLTVHISSFWLWVLGLLPLALSAVTVAVCIERIHEIKKGEEDDLSQY